MRVFVTGASGWIGSAVVLELLGAGHEVVGLARSDASAEALNKAGAEVQRGSLDDLEGLAAAAAASDGVVHLAYKHDIAFSGGFQAAAEADHDAVEVLGEALVGSDRPFLIASGTAGLMPKHGEIATEEDDADPNSPAAARSRSERTARGLSSRGVRSASVRLAPTNHGDGDNGFMATLVGIARDKGVSGYIGDGANRWPAVHRLDTAQLIRLTLEKAEAGVAVHAVAEEGVAIRDIAEAIGGQLNLPVVSVAPDDAAGHFTWLAHFLAMDVPASSALTRELLGWEPAQLGLIDDLNAGHYFR